MITGWLIGDKRVIAKLDGLPDRLQSALQKRVETLALKLLVKVKAEKLSDQVLKVQTGRLRRSINERVETNGTRVTGIVGTNVVYGRAWELGFDRKIGAGARGGPRTLSGKALDTYFAKHPPGTKHYEPRSFLRSALEEMRPQIEKELGLIVRDAAK